jgi:hypothetical protein
MAQHEDNDSQPGQKAPSDDFEDLEALRLSQKFTETVGVRKLLTTVPVRKPNRQEFIRVHPDDSYRLETAVLELKEERETYLVAPQLWLELAGELTAKVLYTTINRQGVLTVWPIRLPGEDARIDAWNASALDAAELARTRWLRITSNMSLGAYEVYEAPGAIPDPEWPDVTFHEIMRIAFKGRYITDVDHPVIARLRGES